ncbi:MAG TPA: alpha/beta hydrolase [Marmoricola sp.]|nr:alpha/beta hydrolase [Marmoricola sp.]
MTRWAPRVAAAAALVMALSACGTTSQSSVDPVVTTTGPMPAAASGLASYYRQKLTWRGCDGDLCAWLRVPLDYAHPRGAQIRLAVLKVPATDPARRVGALVVNPGGPGGSGVNFASAGAQGYFGKALTKYYDIVGFDPRGVGASAPINCGNTAQTDAMISAVPAPSTTAEWEAGNAIARAYMDRCLALSGAIAQHVSTVEAARDMDILRAALSQPKLDYFGASYGTFLGATYAGLFPKNVGRMVLDGAIDPALSTTQMDLQQAHSMQVALESYVSDCVAQGSCPLGANTDAAVARVGELLQQIQAHPLPTATSRELNGGFAMQGVWAPLYVRDNWPDLTAAFSEILKQHKGTKLLALADGYVDRGATAYTDNAVAAQTAVNCLDHDDYLPWQEAQKLTPEFMKASPTFGKAFATMVASCSFYPVRTGNRSAAIRATGAPPIVVIGTTRDPVTPLAWARALAQQLASGVLVTRDGDGHTAYSEGNSCINGAVERYLVGGVVPRQGLAC